MKLKKGIPFSVILFLVLLPFFFQNCAQQKSGHSELSSSNIPKLVSPFENKKVIIDYKSLYQKMGSPKLVKNKKTDEKVIPSRSHLVVNINNQCAVGFCENDKNSGAQTCQLFKKYFNKQLFNKNQAYVYVAEKDLTESDLESTLFSQEVDSYCIVGISQREIYKINFDSTSAEYLASYHHQVVKTNEVYDFFRSEFSSGVLLKDKSRVAVGVVDTGVDFSHPELSSGIGGINTNFSSSCPTEICNFHGTFVAGIIAARFDGNQGSFGIAPNSIIFSYQVGDKSGAIPTEELVNAIQKATVDKVEILNLSLGSSSALDASYQAALVNAINNNILIVAAAGNSNNNLDVVPSYPPSFGFDAIISVGAASPNLIAPLQPQAPTQDQILSTIKKDTFSNYSSQLVGISAPGTAIFSTSPGGQFGVASGTSFSAPMVTGALVLMRGYLKNKDFAADQITPTLLKSILYDSAENLPSLTEKINGSDITYFTNNRFLNLAKMKTYLVDYVNRVGSSPSRIELTDFSVITSGSGSKSGKFKIEIKDADPSLSLTMRVYTNRAFKEESEVVTAQCFIDLARKICEFELPFEKMLIDPEVYFEIKDTRGVVISSLLIPKDKLNFGVKDDAAVAGEIVQVLLADGFPIVEGWACLIGFPDKLEIEIRKNDPVTGPIYTVIRPSQQARGNYFGICNSAEITFGFKVGINDTAKYYFTARHPTDPTKNVLLKAFAYLPKFEDPLPAELIDYVQIDKNWLFYGTSEPQIDISKFTLQGLQVVVEGSACFERIYRPAVVSLNVTAGRLQTIFDVPHLRYENRTYPTAEKSYGSFYKSQNYVNSEYIDRSAERENFGASYPVALFNEISREWLFQGSPALREGEKSYLVESGVYNMKIALSQNTVGFSNPNCPLAGGFSFTYDVGANVAKIASSASILYRSDKTSLDEIYRQNVPLKTFIDTTIVNTKFSELYFNYLSLNFLLATNYTERSLVNLNPLIETNKPLRTVASENIMMPMKNYYSFFPLDLTVAEANEALTKIWESDWIPLSFASKASMVSFEFDQGTKFGTIEEDFVLEVIEEDGVTINRPVFDILATRSSPHMGKIFAEVFTKNKNSKVKLRLLSNSKNRLHINGFGIVTL